MEQIDADTMKEMDAVDLSFKTSFEEATTLQEEDRLEECIEKAEALLADAGIPRYYGIKTLLLLVSTVGDLGEAHQHWMDAETLWRIVRRWLDATMGVLRVEIERFEEDS